MNSTDYVHRRNQTIDWKSRINSLQANTLQKMISALNMQAPNSDAGGNETRKKSYIHSRRIPQA